MSEPNELTLDEVRARMRAANVTIAEPRLPMVQKLLGDALVAVRALDTRTIRTLEPAVRFVPDGGARDE